MLEERTVLVRLSIPVYSGARIDRQVGEHVDEHYRAKKSGRFSKIIIQSKELDAIRAVATSARVYLKTNSHPWYGHGLYLVPTTMLPRVYARLIKFREEFEEAFQHFLDHYPEIKEAQRVRLADLYSESIFPAPMELRQCCQFNFGVEPVPSTNGFEKILGIDTWRADLAEELKNEVEHQMERASYLLKQRVIDTLVSCRDKMQDFDPLKKGSRFCKSWITKITEMCELAQDLNVTEDATVQDLVQRIQGLQLQSPVQYRENVNSRNSLIGDLTVIIARFA